MIYYCVKMIQYVSYMKKRNTFYLVTMCEAQKKETKTKYPKPTKQRKTENKSKNNLVILFW